MRSNMESLVKFVEGNIPKEIHKCFFCDTHGELLFGIINIKNKYINNNDDCYKMDSIVVCNTHAEAINSLLSGDNDTKK